MGARYNVYARAARIMARKRKKNFLGVYLLIAALLLAVAGFWYFFLRRETAKNLPDAPAEPPALKEAAIEEKTPEPDKKLYAMANVSAEIVSRIADKLLSISPAYKELASENIGPMPAGAADVRDLAEQAANDYSFAFDYDGRRYIVTADYSGGAHCCFGWYVFTLDPQNNLDLVPANADIAEMGNVYPEGEANLAQKDGKLYLALADDRFSYYCGTYAESPAVMRYFLIEPVGLTMANADFSDAFTVEAQRDDAALKTYYNSSLVSSGDEAKAARCKLLVERSANYLLAADASSAWDGFDVLFKKLAPMDPCDPVTGACVTAAQFKKDIIDYLSK